MHKLFTAHERLDQEIMEALVRGATVEADSQANRLLDAIDRRIRLAEEAISDSQAASLEGVLWQVGIAFAQVDFVRAELPARSPDDDALLRCQRLLHSVRRALAQFGGLDPTKLGLDRHMPDSSDPNLMVKAVLEGRR